MEEICVLKAEHKKKGLKRYLYERKSISDLDIILNIYTVFCPKSVFTARRLTKICSNYKYVYANDIIFSKYRKCKENSLMNFLPGLSLTKIANMHRVNLAEENIGIVIKSKKLVNISFLTKLCKNIKYIRVYESDKETDNMIMEATGICVQQGKERNEPILVFLDDNMYFNVKGKIIADLIITIPEKLRNEVIADSILYDVLKCDKADMLIKKLNITIKGFRTLDKMI